jgi:hypothetical protein
MALSFTKNVSNWIGFGVNALSGGLAGASAISISAWVRIRTMTTGPTDNGILRVILDATTDGLVFTLSGNQDTQKVRLQVRSATTDAAQAGSGATTVPFNVWTHVGGVVDFSTNTIRQYVNGLPDGSSVVALNATTFTPVTPTSQDTLGGISSSTPATGPQLNGDLGEVAVWKGDVGDDGMKSLGIGYSPMLIRPNLLLEHWDLMNSARGNRRAINGVITGSVPVSTTDPNHPKVIRP